MRSYYQGPITKVFIKNYLPTNPIIIEAGAHIGRDTLKMSLLWPEGTMYAFEPVPELYTQLVERTKELPNVHCFQLALSDHTGTATLYVSSGASTAASSLLEPIGYREDRPEVSFHPQEVPTITVDEWALSNHVTKVDFLWLDMQGAELNVLKAATKVLATVRAILIEVSLTERFRNNPLRKEITSWLHAQGFTAIAEDIPKHNKINLFFIRNI